MCSGGDLPPTHIRRLPSEVHGTASDLLSQKTDMLHNHSYGIARGVSFRSGHLSAKHVQDSHLIPLFKQNKDACPIRKAERVAHLPQKPDVYEIIRAQVLS